MTFKKRRGINLPYKVQGFINFTCLTYASQPQEIKNKIDKLCESVGGEYAAVLFAILTNEHISITQAALKYAVSERTLYRLRKRFYESW